MTALDAGTNTAADVEAVEEIMRRGGPSLRERMACTESHLEAVTAASGAPLASHAAATVAAGGKRLRPLLVVLAAEAAGGPGETSEQEQSLVRAAVAVELVHSATLVHDDLIDRAELRRGRPTVAAGAGRAAAIATGDLLFSRAFAELARNGDPEQLRALSDASSALAAGELLQREDAYAPSVAVERYLERCRLKTAALFEAACRLGALVAVEGTAALAATLGEFAERIGLAFQLLDDVLDVSGPAERTGKARGTDLLDGTVTLPLILARERDPKIASFDIATLASAERLDGHTQAERGRQAELLCERIAATGALEEARERALAIVAGAKATLPEALPQGRYELLDLLADAVVERYC
ncbi:MAG TPA: polyprenyl synthetase family protein [Solirubrobacteraceae bacterium]|jgi:geranylgeranyl pyrophosphate synthase|nr:polyprenyl synthetase family protein [Solirubrobacteraceae bacterium]